MDCYDFTREIVEENRSLHIQNVKTNNWALQYHTTTPNTNFANFDLDRIEKTVSNLQIGPETIQIIKRLRKENNRALQLSEDVATLYNNRNRIAPNTDHWLKERRRYLTASSLASILGENPYSTSNDVYLQKIGASPKFAGNFFTRYGQRYERDAAVVFQYLTGELVIEEQIGLVIHEYTKPNDMYNYGSRYAATPDYVTYRKSLIEIKCPPRRKIAHFVPKHYQSQVQLQLEVCGANLCYFVQYKPPKGEIGLGQFDIVEVPHDKIWFNRVVPKLDTFWDAVLEHHRKFKRDVGTIEYQPLHDDIETDTRTSKKRKSEIRYSLRDIDALRTKKIGSIEMGGFKIMNTRSDEPN